MSMVSRIWLTEMVQSWRGLLRKPSYLLLSTLTLALGAGASALVFSLLDQALLRSLPYPSVERILTIGMQIGDPDGSFNTTTGAPGFYEPIRRMQNLESTGMVHSYTRNVNIAQSDVAEVVPGVYADRGYLQTLGLKMLLGRNFNADEDRSNGPKAVIISFWLWKRSFGGDTAVLGKNLQIEGKPVPIIGVLPKEFTWPDRFDLLLPLQPDLSSTAIATNEYIIGKVRSGVDREAISAQVDAVLRPVLQAQMPSGEPSNALSRLRFGALPIEKSIFTSRSGKVLWMFLAASLCVLAIAAVNLANLMLLRTITRDHDTAVRVALGASTSRLMLPAFSEALLIGILGAVMGLMFAWQGLRLLGNWIPAEWLRGHAPEIGGSSLIFSLIVGVATALFGAALGTWRSRRHGILTELGSGSRTGISRGTKRLARVLIVIQIAAATILLLGASLFARSLQKLSQVPMGFESRSIVTFNLAPLRERNPDIRAVSDQTRMIIDSLERQAGVVDAAASTNLPTGSQLNMYLEFADGRGASMQYRPITAKFPSIFGIPLLAGRHFDDAIDRANTEPVCLISAALSKQFLQGKGIGELVRVMTGGAPISMRVVGIVGDVRQFGPAEPAPPVVYVPLGQIPDDVWSMLREFRPLSYAVRVHPGVETELMQNLPEMIRVAAPNQPISSIQSMQTVVNSTTRDQKLNLLVVGVFSSLALLLAAVGLYAVMAVSVAGRSHEFGVRSALGASPSRLLRQVLGESTGQLMLGLAIGLTVALAASRLMERFLYEVDAADPVAIGVVALVLSLACMLASLMPAWRASRIHPMQALRLE